MPRESFLVVGDPALNRSALFAAAAHAADCEATVVSYAEALAHGDAWLNLVAGRTVRFDSPGHDFANEQAFLALGLDQIADDMGHRFSSWSPATLAGRVRDPGLIFASRQWFLGWQVTLHRLAPAGRGLNHPTETATMFDKVACHESLRASGVPVPPALAVPGSFDELMETMRAAQRSRVFLKPAHGSAASGVVALETSRGHLRATTAVELAGTGDAIRAYATNRLRVYQDAGDIRQLIDVLARERLHVETWVPKAAINDRVCDVRVVVIGGIAGPLVVRLAESPVTNLHLGALKGDAGLLARVGGRELLTQVADVAERAAGCFPQALFAGIDLLITPDFRRVLVAEVNAFGDLLENTTWAGADTYTWELRAWLDGERPPRCDTVTTSL